MLGFVGSAHCLGMCGPIALALPLHRSNWLMKFAGTLLYSIGRIITYGFLGALFGLLGKGIYMAGFQRWVSIIFGAMMILSVLVPFVFRGFIDFNRFISGYSGRLIGGLKNLFVKRTLSSLFFIGLLNGLLPCGLVYVAIAGAISTSSVTEGVIYMVLFGIGTAPALMAVSLLGSLIGKNFRKAVNKVIPVIIIIIGILFILRGLNLGIKYISPPEKMLTPEKEMVHKKCCGGS